MKHASNSVTGGQDFDSKPFGPAGEAYCDLIGRRRWLDCEGVEIGVSRQALDQMLLAYERMTRRLDKLTGVDNGGLDRADDASNEPKRGAR